jgi:RNA polymerase sigma-70 factor (ECF subfamily)
MSDSRDDTSTLIKQARAGDPNAPGELFRRFRTRLRRAVELRLDRRMRGRVDPSDVLQDAYVEFAAGLPRYLENPQAPLFLWMRQLTMRKLHVLHRHHLATVMRDARREISLQTGAFPQASSASLAARILGRHSTPSMGAMRAELRKKVEEALNVMDPIDREVLALRHFEQLSNGETARILDISDAAASIRFVRALKRLKEILESLPGVLPDKSGDA